jgi:ABC-2 type transport system permease protein
MNTRSNAVAGFASHAVEPHSISATQRMYWSVRRELWEHRSIYAAPLAVAVLALFGSSIEVLTLPRRLHGFLGTLDPAAQHQIIEMPYDLVALLIMGTTFIVGIFYCLDALHGERRDRSILFWKSLPVSDLTTVLSKVSIPLVILPLVTFAITVALHFVMLLLASAVLLGGGLSVATYWQHVSVFQVWVGLLYHLVAVHSLGWAPFWGWLLLVSAWARRVPFLWATLPLLAIGIVEKIAFNTSHFGAMLGSRIGGGAEMGSSEAASGMSMATLNHQTLAQFVVSPGLWIGLIIAAAFLAAAVRLRRYREPI